MQLAGVRNFMDLSDVISHLSFYTREKTPPDAKSFLFSTSALLHPVGEGKER